MVAAWWYENNHLLTTNCEHICLRQNRGGFSIMCCVAHSVNIYWNKGWISNIESYLNLKNTKSSGDFPEVTRECMAELGFSSDLFFHPEASSFFILCSSMGWVGSPKTLVRSTDSLKGPTELRGAILLIIMVHCSEKIQVKIRKGKRHVGQSLGETNVFPVICSQWVTWAVLNSLAMTW